MTFREMHHTHKLLFSMSIFLLVFVELRDIRIDKNKNDAEQSRARSEQSKLMKDVASEFKATTGKLEQSAGLITGGDSFPVFAIGPVMDSRPGLPVMVSVTGKHDLFDATIGVMPHIQYFTGAHKKSPQEFLEAFSNKQIVTMPLVSTKQSTIMSTIRLIPEGKDDTFVFDTVARNGRFSQTLEIVNRRGMWIEKLSRVLDNDGKLLLSTSDESAKK
jgi:hypothetical protein